MNVVILVVSKHNSKPIPTIFSDFDSNKCDLKKVRSEKHIAISMCVSDGLELVFFFYLLSFPLTLQFNRQKDIRMILFSSNSIAISIVTRKSSTTHSHTYIFHRFKLNIQFSIHTMSRQLR